MISTMAGPSKATLVRAAIVHGRELPIDMSQRHTVRTGGDCHHPPFRQFIHLRYAMLLKFLLIRHRNFLLKHPRA